MATKAERLQRVEGAFVVKVVVRAPRVVEVL